MQILQIFCSQESQHVIFFDPLIPMSFLIMVGNSVRKICTCADEIRGTQKTKQKPEPVSSTSRRGARAAYHDEYPRDFGPRIAYTVSLVSDTSRSPTLCRPPIRQGGREMPAPRPYETYPFHPPALFLPHTNINFHIYTKFSRHMHDAGFAAAVRRDKHESTVYLLRRQRTAVMDSVPRKSVFKV